MSEGKINAGGIERQNRAAFIARRTAAITPQAMQLERMAVKMEAKITRNPPARCKVLLAQMRAIVPALQEWLDDTFDGEGTGRAE